MPLLQESLRLVLSCNGPKVDYCYTEGLISGCTSEDANCGRQRSNPGLYAFGCLGSTGLTRKRQFAS